MNSNLPTTISTQNNAKLMSQTDEYYGQLLNVAHIHIYTIQNNAKLMSRMPWQLIKVMVCDSF